MTAVTDDDVIAVAVPDAGAGVDRRVTLTLPPAWPAAPPTVAGDVPPLPSPLAPWTPGTTTLSATLDGVAAAFDAAAPVAALLADIDRHCVVLDPPLPAPAAATWRRLALPGGRASVEVDLGGGAAAARPAFAFLGPPAAVDGPRAAAARGAWRPEAGGAAALEALLGGEGALERRRKRGDDGARDAAARASPPASQPECAVCYAYRLEGGPPPSIACANGRCGRPFHAACLRGWLQQTAGEGAEGGGGALRGACPYCGDAITLDE